MAPSLHGPSFVPVTPSGDSLVLYLLNGVALLIATALYVKLPLREMPLNPLHWHLWILESAWRKDSTTFIVSGFGCGLSFCCLLIAQLNATGMLFNQ